jgi:YVTN family beta-propeller protein
MTLSRRASFVVTTLVLAVLVAGCGETFRPVVLPEPQPGPDPQAPKQALVLSTTGAAPGIGTHINLAGDTNVGQSQLGLEPVHALSYANNTRVIVANRGSSNLSSYSTISPVNPSVNTVTLPTGAQPTFLFSNQPNATVFVAMSGLNAVGVVSLGSLLFTTQIPLPATPVALTGTSDGNKLYSANANGTVSVIDARNHVVNGTINVGGAPVYATVSSDSQFVYVVNGGGFVSVINTATDALHTTPSVTVGTAPTFAFFDARLQRLYVPNSGSNSLSIINVDRLSATGFLTVTNVPVGTAPKYATALPDGSKVYVSNSGSNTVTVISTLGNTVLRTVAVGSTPENIVASSDSTKVAVLNKGSNNVTTFRTTDDTTAAVNLPAGTPTYMLLSQ